MSDILDTLRQCAGAPSATEVRTFEVWPGGRQVRVEVHDSGPQSPENAHTRYHAYAYFADVPEAERTQENHSLGNAEATPEAAVRGVHWWLFNPNDEATA